MKQIIDLKMENGKNLSINREYLKDKENELYEFLNDLDYVHTLKFVKSVLLRDEIKSNNAIEGINNDINSIKKALRGRSKKITLTRQRIINLYHGYQYILNNKSINKDTLKELYNILSKDILEAYDANNMGEFYRLKPVYILKGGYLSKAKSFDYHQNKTKTAEENDYQCFHIFDWDNEEKIALQFSLMNKINQNNTYIKEISKEAYDSFMNTQIHKVNNILSDSIRFGLYLKDTNELVFVISLKLLSNNSYKIEEYMDSKYFSIECIPIFLNYFIENYKPNIIAITHDNSKFNGNYLTKLGFKLFNYGDPEVNWNKHNKKEYYKGKFLNTDLFINSGFVEVYDCGQSTWIWNKG